jgi:hypothetical protein
MGAEQSEAGSAVRTVRWTQVTRPYAAAGTLVAIFATVARSHPLDVGPPHAPLQHGCDGATALGVFCAALVLARFRLCLN